MGQLLRTRIRRVGNSRGIIIPREDLEWIGAREHDEILVHLSRPRSSSPRARLERLGGKYRGLPPFEREKNDRY